MISSIRSLVDLGLRWSPFQPAFRLQADRTLAVLAYHGIEDAERFEEHLTFFRRHMHPIGLQELIDAAHRRSSFPLRALLLTFDDGDRSVVDVAMPMLRERAIPAIAFVIPGLLGSQNLVWWDEVEALIRAGGRATGYEDRRPAEVVSALKRLPTGRRARVIGELRASSPVPPPRTAQLTGTDLSRLRSAGIEVGNHTYSHASLARSTGPEVEAEITRAHDALTSELGQPPRTFAYPNGDWASEADEVLRSLGYEAAFLFDHRTQPVPVRDPLRISRLRVDDSTSMDRLRITLSGLHPAVHRLRGRS